MYYALFNIDSIQPLLVTWPVRHKDIAHNALKNRSRRGIKAELLLVTSNGDILHTITFTDGTLHTEDETACEFHAKFGLHTQYSNARSTS